MVWALVLGSMGVWFGVGVREAGGRKYADEVRDRPPKNYVIVESCAPGKGTVWVDQQSADERFRVMRRPTFEVPAAALGYQAGKLVLIQYRFPAARLTEGQKAAWIDAGQGWEGVDHVDLVYVRGAADYMGPHYEVRLYLVSHSEHESYCPGEGKSLRETTKSKDGEIPHDSGSGLGLKPKERVRGEGGSQ